MKRIIVDSQSNKLFRGVEAEQDYDQRGGLCQVGEGHVVVVTNPIDPTYLTYWSALGFTLPEIIQAGPFDPSRRLSELVCHKEDVRHEIECAVNGADARLEFFWIDESERLLVDALGIRPYCSFDVSITLANKLEFKKMCEEIGLRTAPWIGGNGVDDLATLWNTRFCRDESVLVKASNGTGGMTLGGICHIGV